jgi:hypothetical protein
LETKTKRNAIGAGEDFRHTTWMENNTFLKIPELILVGVLKKTKSLLDFTMQATLQDKLQKAWTKASTRLLQKPDIISVPKKYGQKLGLRNQAYGDLGFKRFLPNESKKKIFSGTVEKLINYLSYL